ncbi:hypothetical protein IAU60_006928 [Kwoniella sp. DSM 27419]
MAKPYTNQTPFFWTGPAVPGVAPATSFLWEHAAIPPSVLAVDSHQALLAHVGPPRQQPPTDGDEQDVTDMSKVTPLIPIDEQLYADSPGSPPDDRSAPHDGPGPVQGRSSAYSAGASKRPSTERGPSPTKKSRTGSGSATRNSQSGSKEPSPTKSSPTRRSRTHVASIDMHSRVTDSAKQRSAKSTLAKRFWNDNKDERIRFTGAPLLVRRLIFSLRNQLCDPPNKASAFLGSHNALLFAEENNHSEYTPEGSRALRDRTVSFDTYLERDDPARPFKLVNYQTIGGKEFGSTAATLFGVCKLANNYVRHTANFKNRLDVRHRYRLAPLVDSGISDIAARLDPDPEEIIVDGWLQTFTPFLVEKKLYLTHRDLMALVYVLGEQDIHLYVRNEQISVTTVSEDDQRLLSAAIKSILAQLYQQLHVNMAEYVLLTTYDVSILFRLSTRYSVEVSGLIFRDYDSFLPRFTDGAPEILRIVSPPQQSRMINAFREPHTPLIERAEYSLLSILVAGLVVPKPSDLNQKTWIKPALVMTTSTGQGDSARSAPSSAHQSSRSTGTSASTGSRTGSFQLSVNNALVTQLVRTQSNTTHYFPFRDLQAFHWSRVTPDPPPMPQRLSTDSDTMSSELSIPSLTTDSSGSTWTTEAQDQPESPKPNQSISLPRAIPPNKPKAVTIVDLDLRSSVSLRPSAKLDDMGLPIPGRHESPVTALHLSIVSYVGSGRTWDTYRAQAVFHAKPGPSSNGKPVTTGVIVKICNYMTYPDVVPEEDTVDEGLYAVPYTKTTALRAIHNEVAMLTGPLNALQGKVCPTLYGLWTGEWWAPEGDRYAEFHCMVMEDCGRPWWHEQDGQPAEELSPYDK